MGISSALRGDPYNFAKIPNFRSRTKNSPGPENAQINAELDALFIFKKNTFKYTAEYFWTPFALFHSISFDGLWRG